jgi:hypothetical protein
MANTITKRMGCWIQFQLKLNGYTQDTVAEVAGRNSSIVSQFLLGYKGSSAVKTALCKVLGYRDFDALTWAWTVADKPYNRDKCKPYVVPKAAQCECVQDSTGDAASKSADFATQEG